MTIILPALISPKQSAFISGKSIFEHIMLAQEMVHLLNRKSQEDYVMIKIDMAKVYDWVNWSFLLNVLTGFGLSKKFYKLVVKYVQAP